jgi:hypothetical protein
MKCRNSVSLNARRGSVIEKEHKKKYTNKIEERIGKEEINCTNPKIHLS